MIKKGSKCQIKECPPPADNQINPNFQPYQQNQPPFPQQIPQRKPTSALAVSSLVLGIISIILSFIPFINNFAFLLALVGLALSIAGLVATGKTKNEAGKGLAVAGVILCVLSIIITLVMQQATSKAIDTAFSNTASSSQTSTAKSKDPSPSQKSDSSKNTEDKTSEGKGNVDGDRYTVELVSLVKSIPDSDGKPTVLLTYKVINNMKKNSNPLDINIKAFQNKRQLDTAIYFDQPQGYDPGSFMKTIQPGGVLTVTIGYVLEDETSPVTIEVTGTVDFSKNPQKVTKTYELTK